MRRRLGRCGLSSVHVCVFLLALGIGLYSTDRISETSFFLYILFLFIGGAFLKSMSRPAAAQKKAPAYGMPGAAKDRPSPESPARMIRASLSKDFSCANAGITMNLLFIIAVYGLNAWFVAFRFYGAPQPPVPGWFIAIYSVLNLTGPISGPLLKFGDPIMLLNIQTIACGIMIIGAVLFYLGNYRAGAWLTGIGSLFFMPAGILGLVAAIKARFLESAKDKYTQRGKTRREYTVKRRSLT